MRYSYKPKGVCSKSIGFELEGGRVHNLSFEGGCPGNLQGLARLAEGREVREIVALLSGLKCGRKKTSCPDQLAKALKKASRPSAQHRGQGDQIDEPDPGSAGRQAHNLEIGFPAGGQEGGV